MRVYKRFFEVVLHRSREEEETGRGKRLCHSYTFADAQCQWEQFQLSSLPENAYSLGLVERPNDRMLAVRRAA